eukprot:12406176-Ditylum_brightwellii.AAC.1
MLLSQSTTCLPVNTNPLLLNNRPVEADLSSHVDYLGLMRNEFHNDFQASNVFGNLSHQPNTAMRHNAGSSPTSQSWGNALISAANSIYNPLQLSVSPSDYLKPSFVATESQESNFVQRALHILYPDQYPPQEVNILSRHLQGPLLTAASLLSQTNTRASALSAPPGGISTVIPNDYGRNKALDDDKCAKLSNTYVSS